eukprot:4720192-Prymnesium_polylepis.2
MIATSRLTASATTTADRATSTTARLPAGHGLHRLRGALPSATCAAGSPPVAAPAATIVRGV